MEKFKKKELELLSLTIISLLCTQQGLDPTGDKPTLITRLLGKKEPEPEPEPEPTSEPETPPEE